jgi:hypothetical protein
VPLNTRGDFIGRKNNAKDKADPPNRWEGLPAGWKEYCLDAHKTPEESEAKRKKKEAEKCRFEGVSNGRPMATQRLRLTSTVR